MATLKEIKQRLETISFIGTITSIYQDVAHFRMHRIQQEVLRNREFLEGLAKTYNLAKRSYLASFRRKKEKKPEKILFIGGKRKKEVVIFLSASEFFYGTLLSDLWQETLDYLRKSGADLIVVGRIGKTLVERSKLGWKMIYFELNLEKPETQRIKEIVEYAKGYAKITVFHGRYETVMAQKPVHTDISGGAFLKEEGGEIKDYLFEPSAEEILKFFETEIISALFDRVLLEHQLARYAARMIEMYQATERANDMIKELKKMERRLKKQLADKRQIEFFGSLKLWS